MKSHQLINQTSGETEYFTPMPIVDAARRVMGSIELDPASSTLANERIKAEAIYTKEDDGLRMNWFGTVWVNHPFHAGWKACDEKCQRKTCRTRGHIYHDIPSNADWVSKMVCEYARVEVLAIICITFAATSEDWFQPLAAYPQCFLVPRTNYHLPDGTLKKGVSKGSVVTYMGPDVDKFALEFASMGTIKVPYGARLPYGPCQCAICQDGMVDYWCQNCQDWFRAEQTPVHAKETECPKCRGGNTYEAAIDEP